MIPKQFISLLLLTGMLVFSLFACRHDDPIPNTIDPAMVNTTITSGTWRVTLYNDGGQDETVNFAGYAFSFLSGNVVTAVKGGQMVTGTWSTQPDASHTKLILNFMTPADFVDISDDWHVIERTDTKIRLEDVSGGNGGTDYLTFEKN